MKFFDFMNMLDEFGAYVIDERKHGDCTMKIYAVENLRIIIEYFDVEGLEAILMLKILSGEGTCWNDVTPKKGVKNRWDLIRERIKQGF